MFRRYLILLILCFLSCGTVASAQSSPEHEKLKVEARAAYDRGDFEKAKEFLNQVLSQNPKDHSALFLRASARVEHGVLTRDGKEIRDGIEDSRESIKVGGGGEINYYMPYLFGMVSLANLDGKAEHANVALDVAKSVLNRSTLTPEQRADVLNHRASAHLILGMLNGRSQDADGAMKELNLGITDFQEAIKAFPSHLNSYMRLAETYKNSGQFDRALATYNTAMEVIPNNQIVYNNRGLFFQQQGRNREAISDFTKAIELDKDFATAYTNRGFTNTMSEGSFSAAEADFTIAISLQPNNPLFTSLRGSARLSQGNTEGAIEDYTQVIKLNPNNPVAYADLGFARFFTRDFAGASVAFEQAIKFAPDAMRYIAPWQIWSLILSGKPDAVDVIAEPSLKKAENDRDWIDQQVLFIIGKGVSEKGLVDFVMKANAPKIPEAELKKLRDSELCEAYFFIAERRLQANDNQTATAFYQQVIQTKQKQLSAYRGAQFALKSFSK